MRLADGFAQKALNICKRMPKWGLTDLVHTPVVRPMPGIVPAYSQSPAPVVYMIAVVMTSLRFLPASVALGLAVFAGSPAMAQTWIQDFNNDDSDDWETYSPASEGTFTIADGVYNIQAAAPLHALLGPGRAGSLLKDVTVSDFRISVDLVDWADELPQSLGIVARVNEFELGEADGYFFNYSPGPSAGRNKGEIEITRFDDEMRHPEVFAAAQLTEDLNSAFDYRFVFTGVGGLLTGSVYRIGDETPIATVELFDDEYLSGRVGLLVMDSNPDAPSSQKLGPANATFDNFSVSAIPEPSTYATLAGLVVGVAAFWLRRKPAAVA